MQYEWEGSKDVIKNALNDVLDQASTKLSIRNADHRKIQSKINDILEDLEKSWTVKSKTIDEDEMMAEVVENELRKSGSLHFQWRNATVAWLSNVISFQPSALPGTYFNTVV